MADEYEFPVSPAQARLLVLDRLHPGSTQYHVPAAFTVTGPFDVEAFTAALDALVARHESLRTVFRAGPDGYRQIVAAEARASVRVVDGGTEADLRADAARPFDVEHGPLLRATVWSLAGGSHRILLVAHHLVCDGWSMRIMLDELAQEPDDVEPPRIQYPDYAVWQRDRLASGEYDEAVAYWRGLLDGAPETLELPTDRARSAVVSTAGGVERFVLPRDRLGDLARARGTTPFAVLFAAYNAFLSRISGRLDLVVGVPVAGRVHADVEG
jgi:hypothetical protein